MYIAYKFNKNKLDNSTIKYTVNSESGKLTYRDFIELLKSENNDFLTTFRDELNRASAELSAYF
jgi:hypothetical protein